MTSPRTSLQPSARAGAAAGLAAVVALVPAALGAAPAQAADDATAPPVADKPLGEKFSTHDATLLAEARAADEPYVTMMIAAEPGRTAAVADQLDAVEGASVGYTEASVGYVRLTVRTSKADAAIARATGMAAVRAIDLNDEIAVPDPAPGSVGGRHGGAGSYDGPDADTPAANPYQPAHETGAVEFVRHHPRADGRGITIGVLDTGVDLMHPALRETTTNDVKITDWVTATDPIIDGDGTWRPMVDEVSGESFDYRGVSYTAPAGDHLISIFSESVTEGSEIAGDLDRDGQASDTWAVLYDAEAGTVRVDLDGDADFTNNEAMKPFGDSRDIGFFGTDDPQTEVAEAIPFVVEIREDVPMDPYGGDWVGQTRDFVNIGIVSDAHGTHVAGIAAANGLFGGEMSGAAPGAQIVSSRACSFAGGCTFTALTEGMIDLVVNRGVDVVNMSIGGLPALNDGNNARAHLYNELIETYGVQLVLAAGNEGPGTNTVGDPSVADLVVSVGASISRETWAANYGSRVERRHAMLPFSSAGPRDDGGFKPTLSAPGASINSIPTWQEGSPVPEAGYDLPPGYGMLNGTSMASPQAAGAVALLLSAAEQQDVPADPAALRTALMSSADRIHGVQAHEQGAGRFDTEGAWRLLRQGAHAHDYTVRAPVDHVLADYLATPGSGTGVYDRESAPAVGESEQYEVTLTRTTGPDRPVKHRLKLVNNHDHTFRLHGPASVRLPLDEPVTVTLTAHPRSLGAHSAILTADDGHTAGTDLQVLATITVAQDLTADGAFEVTHDGSVQRNDSDSYFVRVPEGTHALQVAMDGLAELSQTRWIAITPWGTPAESTASNLCYPHYNPGNPCPADVRAYEEPEPGVWEIEVESRRTSPQLDNPYTVAATAYGGAFDPEVWVVEPEEGETSIPLTFDLRNDLAPVDGGQLAGGGLGSVLNERPSIDDGEYATREVEVPEGVSELSISIGAPSDPATDLDLYVYQGDTMVGASTSSTAEELVTLTDPAAGTYTVEIHGYAVPSGSTEYDYQDVFFSPDFGQVAAEERLIALGTGEESTVGATVNLATSAPEGRDLLGELRLLNDRGTPVAAGGILIERAG